METFTTPITSAAIDFFTRVIAAGELIVVPTDTVYGIGADPKQVSAVDRLLTAKGRGRDFPSPVLVADYEQAGQVVRELPPVAQQLAAAFWPGALTMVLPAREELGWDLGITQGTVAIRIPDQDDLRELLRKVGPLAVTSANLHGQPAATSCAEAKRYFGDRVAGYLDGGKVSAAAPSTIIKLGTDLSVPEGATGLITVGDTLVFRDWQGCCWEVLRVGAIAAQDLATVARQEP